MSEIFIDTVSAKTPLASDGDEYWITEKDLCVRLMISWKVTSESPSLTLWGLIQTMRY